MVLDLYLLRHGETNLNINRGIIGGRSNFSDLSERGEKQAGLLGFRLFQEGIRFDEVYSSTTKRAIETARIACSQIAFPFEKIKSCDGLLELDQGDWEGKIRKECYTPEVLDQMVTENWNFRPPNGESQNDVAERIYAWVKENLLPKSEQNLTAAIFGHGVSTKCFLTKALDSDHKISYRMTIDNCSISHIKYSPEGRNKGWTLIKINDNGHLREVGFSSTNVV